MKKIQFLLCPNGGLVLLAVVSLVLLTGCDNTSEAPDSHDHSEHAHDHDDHATSNGAEPSGDPYMLATDAVTGESLGDSPVIVVVDEREFRFANKANAQRFKDSADDFIETVDAQMIAMQLDEYPLGVCVVSGAELGSMGEPVNRIVRNRLVRLCCAGCDEALEANAEEHLKTLDEAVIAQQVAAYPTDRCIVSDEALTDHGGPVDRVYGTQLVRFCCGGCVTDFEKNPAAYQAQLNALQ